ncbi:MAG: hypothetical protein Q9165_000181 [Trypethelium subeluteriae]
MASAASPAGNLQPLDPFKQARYSVSFAGKKRKAEAYASVQYNHKPQQASQKRTTTLKASSEDPQQLQLLIRDTNAEGDNKELYRYMGQSSSGKDVYAVLFDPQTRKCILAPVNSQYTFNLTSTPKEKDITKLQKQYDQIKLQEPTAGSSDAEEDLFGDARDQLSEDGSDTEASFFDWRNFISRGRSSSPDRANGTPRVGALSAQNTPLLSAQGVQSAIASKPKPQPRSQNGPTSSKTKDVFSSRKKAVSPLVAPSRKPTTTAPKKEKKSAPAPLPNIHTERRPSARPQPSKANVEERNLSPASRSEEAESKPSNEDTSPTTNMESAEYEDDEADGLVLDFDSPTVPSKRPSAFGLAAAAAASSGPISLRSAASSPGSRLASPALRATNNRTPMAVHEEADSDEDDEMGGLEIEVPDVEEEQGVTSYTFDDGDEDEDEEDDGGRDEGAASGRGGDSDVDALELPSPAADTRGSRALSPPNEMEEDENVDLEAEMLQALASDEDDGNVPNGGQAVGGGGTVQEESESESEEE